MLIDQLKAKIEGLRDRVKVRLPWYLQPFRGAYLDALTAFLLGNLDMVKRAWEEAHESGNVHKLVDFLIDLARGNLALPIYLRPFSGIFLEVVRQWLHLNADALKDKVGELPAK